MRCGAARRGALGNIESLSRFDGRDKSGLTKVVTPFSGVSAVYWLALAVVCVRKPFIIGNSRRMLLSKGIVG